MEKKSRAKERQPRPGRNVLSASPGLSTGRFTFVFVFSVLAVELLIWNWRDPFWLYVFFWRGGWLRLDGYATTAGVLWGNQILGWLWLLSLACLAVILRREERFQRFVSNNWTVVCVIVVILPVSLILVEGVFRKPQYEKTLALVTQLNSLVKFESLAPRPLIPPFDYVYVDEASLTGMSAQFEPALREDQRTVQIEGRLAAEAKVGVGNVAIGASGAQQRAETSQLKAVPATIQRKASDLIVGLAERKQLRVYKDFASWFIVRATGPLRDLAGQLERLVRFGTIGPDQAPNVDDIKLQLKNLQAEADQELRELRGQVVVEGEWKVSMSGPDLSQLVHQFYPSNYQGSPVTFECRVPSAALVSKRDNLELRVFATVVSSDGKRIELKPLALFY